MKKIFLTSIVCIILFSLILPWFLYWYGLSNLLSYPILPINIALSETEKATIWNQHKESGTINIRKMSPYDLLSMFFSSDKKAETKGERITWWIARNIKNDTLKDKRNFIRLLTVNCLTIWLSRNWTEEQIFQKAKDLQPIVQKL